MHARSVRGFAAACARVVAQRHRRPISTQTVPHAAGIPIISAEGKRLFAEALEGGTMECYFPLAAQYRMQEDASLAGLTSLVMVLNALSIDPRRLWKAPWRWFSEEMLDCCVPIPTIRARGGMDLETFACLATCNSAAAHVQRPPPLTASPAASDHVDHHSTAAGVPLAGHHHALSPLAATAAALTAAAAASPSSHPIHQAQHSHHHHTQPQPHHDHAGCCGGGGGVSRSTVGGSDAGCCDTGHSNTSAASSGACSTADHHHHAADTAAACPAPLYAPPKRVAAACSHDGCDSGSSLQHFRHTVHKVARSRDGEFLVLAYARAALAQAYGRRLGADPTASVPSAPPLLASGLGGGHFSPLGGYHVASDMALVLDVARDSHVPCWVPLDDLWSAMSVPDPHTRQPRGYVRVQRRAAAPLLLFHLSSRQTLLGAPGQGDGSLAASLAIQPSPTLTSAASAPSGSSGGGALSSSVCLNRQLRQSLEDALRACNAALVEQSQRLCSVHGGDGSSSSLSAGAAPSGVGCSHHHHHHRRHDSSSVRPPDDAADDDTAAVRTGVDVFITAFAGGADDSLHDRGVTAAGDARCIDKLSRAHIHAAGSLLRELEGTRLYGLVREALLHTSSGAGKTGRPAGAGSTGAIGDNDDDDADAGYLTSETLPPGSKPTFVPPRTPAMPPPLPTSGGSAMHTTAGCSSTPPLASPLAPAAASAASTSDVSAAFAGSAAASDIMDACPTCGVSCIRVRKAHVLTLLLMSWAVPHDDAIMRRTPTKSLHSCTAREVLPAVLMRAAAQAVAGGSELLRNEVLLLNGQLHSGGVTLEFAPS